MIWRRRQPPPTQSDPWPVWPPDGWRDQLVNLSAFEWAMRRHIPDHDLNLHAALTSIVAELERHRTPDLVVFT